MSSKSGRQLGILSMCWCQTSKRSIGYDPFVLTAGSPDYSWSRNSDTKTANRDHIRTVSNELLANYTYLKQLHVLFRHLLDHADCLDTSIYNATVQNNREIDRVHNYELFLLFCIILKSVTPKNNISSTEFLYPATQLCSFRKRRMTTFMKSRPNRNAFVRNISYID